jgi:hypothetical protein
VNVLWWSGGVFLAMMALGYIHICYAMKVMCMSSWYHGLGYEAKAPGHQDHTNGSGLAQRTRHVEQGMLV